MFARPQRHHHFFKRHVVKTGGIGDRIVRAARQQPSRHPRRLLIEVRGPSSGLPGDGRGKGLAAAEVRLGLAMAAQVEETDSPVIVTIGRR